MSSQLSRSFTSPVCDFMFPCLVGIADDNKFSVTMVLDPDDPEHGAFMQELEHFNDECFVEMQKEHGGDIERFKILKDAKDRDKNPTGKFWVQVTMKAYVTPQKGGRFFEAFHQTPAIFDCASPVKAILPKSIGNGTRGRVNFDSFPFYMSAHGAGMGCRLQSVQIVELSEGAKKTASDFGFEPVAGGYSEDKKSTVEVEVAEKQPSVDSTPF